MNRKLVNLLAALALVAGTQGTYAVAQGLSGTAQMYDPFGGIVGPPIPITGSYDDALMHVSIDPWLFFGSETYSEIDLLDPGVHDRPGAGTVTVDAGQVGGFILTDWGPNVDLPAFIVWDVLDYPGGTHFEPIDSDGDGVPGHAMITGPFPGFSIVYEFDVGAPAPDIDVTLNVPGGTRQECDELDGKQVLLSATANLDGGAVLDSIDWAIDGEPAGFGNGITPFLALGAHTVEVTATTTEGIYDTATAVVSVVDTTPPSLSVEFVDVRSGEPVTSVEHARRVRFVEIQLDAGDVCDDDVDVLGDAKTVTAIMGGEVIKIRGKNRQVKLPTTAIEVSATATDDSGNKQTDHAILPIDP